MASLFVVRGNDQGCRFEIEADLLTIGRDVGNHVQLHDTEVSRRHAIIRAEGRQFVVTDNKSSNGTFVNGKRITTQTLRGGDEVQLGSTVLLFTGGGEGPSSLAEKIDIVSRGKSDDRSRIVRAIPQAEGRGIFAPGTVTTETAATSPFLAKARSNLEVMYRTTLAVSHTLDIDQLLQSVMQLIFEWVECDRGCVMLVDADTKRLEPRVRRNRRSQLDDTRLVISKTILDHVMEQNEGVLISDASTDAKFSTAASIVQAGIREAICAPMQGRHSLVGVVYLDVSTSPQQVLQSGNAARFNEEHLRLLIAIAHQAAMAVEDTRYYSAMVQAERLAAVGQAIAGLSHHVKNILQGIRGGSYLIKEGLSTHNEPMVSKGWEFVEKNQDRISQLVMDMLTFSKEREPELVPADLNRVVGDVVELMEARGRQQGVKLHFEPTTGIPKLTFDPEGLHRAVLNVVSNAIDACDPRRREDRGEGSGVRAAAAHDEDHAPVGDSGIDTALAASDPQVPLEGSGVGGPPTPPVEPLVHISTIYDPTRSLVQVAVEDNGGGIPETEVEHIFSLFVSNKGNRGTGLGLPVSQKIMKEHGGRIGVESRLGHGAKFVLEMPAVPADVTRHPDDSGLQ